MSWLLHEQALEYILQYMKQILIKIDDEMAARLEQVAPVRSRQRSEFIRNALRRALWEIEERATAAAYAKIPDSEGDAYFDPRVWETRSSSTSRGKTSSTSGRRRSRRR